MQSTSSERTEEYRGSDRAGAEKPPSAFECWSLEKLLSLIGHPRIAVELWNGERFIEPASDLVVQLNSRRALYRLLRNASIGFGESYTDASITVPGDLVALMEEIYRGLHRVDHGRGLKQVVRTLLAKRPRPNSLDTSRDNIHSHYDLGNDFYRLWLDHEYMQYTCAYYPRPEATLQEAQIAKLEHVCRKLNLRPGETVVEAGSGWGGLARYMAERHGVKVRSYNISSAQVAFARERARQCGLEDLVEYVEDDYRNIAGSYDVFVSVGMLEHVGVENYGTLGAVVDRSLKEDGRGLIHSIGRNQSRRMDDWIEKRIFPGAYPPTIGEMMQIFEPKDLTIADIENLRSHYARTLTDWYKRYQGHFDAVCELFDESFARAWRLYLAGSIAAFTSGELQLFQVLFQRPESKALPVTRDHLYVDG